MWECMHDDEHGQRAGWFLLESPDSDPIEGKETVDRASFCVRNYSGAKYLPEDLFSHVVARAYCIDGPAVELQDKLRSDAVKSTLVQPTPVVVPDPVPVSPVVAPDPPAEPEPPVLPEVPVEPEAPVLPVPPTLPSTTPTIPIDPVVPVMNTPPAAVSSAASNGAAGEETSADATAPGTPAPITSASAADSTPGDVEARSQVGAQSSPSTGGTHQGSDVTVGPDSSVAPSTETIASPDSSTASNELAVSSRSAVIQEEINSPNSGGASSVWFIAGGVGFLAVAGIVGVVAVRRLRKPVDKVRFRIQWNCTVLRGEVWGCVRCWRCR